MPILIVWDEHIEENIGERICERVIEFLEKISKESGSQVYVSVDLLNTDGTGIIQAQPLKEFNRTVKKQLLTGMDAGALLQCDFVKRLSIESRLHSFAGQQASATKILAPLVLLVTGRNWVRSVDVRQLAVELFAGSANSQFGVARLAVLASEMNSPWSAKWPDKPKYFLGANTSRHSSEIDAFFRNIYSFVIQKIEEKRPVGAELNGAQIPASDSPRPSLHTGQVPKVQVEQSRPTISVNESASKETLHQPVVPPSTVPERVAQPGVPEQNPSPVQQGTDVSQNYSETSTERVDPSPEETESVLDLPTRSRKIRNKKNKKDDDGTGGFLRHFRGKDTTKAEGESEPQDGTHVPDENDGLKPLNIDVPVDEAPSVSEPDTHENGEAGSELSQNTGDVPVTTEVETTPESENLTPIEYPPPAPKPTHTRDGQEIVDRPSSLNAKPWYEPNWKKMPMTSPSRDIDLDFGSLDELRLMVGSVRGTKHQFYEDENQDAFFVIRTKSLSHVVIAIADGVSNAKYSAYGSKKLTYLVSSIIASAIDDQVTHDLDIPHIIDQAVRKASDKVQQWHLDELYAPPVVPDENSRKLISATLCVAVVETAKRSNNARGVYVGCVGDSPCYTLQGHAWHLRSTATKEGELLEHATRALPVPVGADPGLERFDFELHESEMLVMMTDGIGTSLGSGKTPVGEWLAPRLYKPLLSNEFVAALTFDRQGEDDDRTLAILYDFAGVTNTAGVSHNGMTSGNNGIEQS